MIDANGIVGALGEIQDYLGGDNDRWDRALHAAMDIITKAHDLAVSLDVGAQDVDRG